MRVVFHIYFRSVYGQSLFLRLPDELAGKSGLISLHYENEDTWKAEIDIKDEAIKEKSSAVIVLMETGKENVEGNHLSILPGKVKGDEVHIFADWYATIWDKFIYNTKAFNFLSPLKKEKEKALLPIKKTTHFFEVQAPCLPAYFKVCITGNIKDLGTWEKEDCMLLRYTRKGWKGRLHLKDKGDEIVYKYGIYDTRLKKLVHYEAEENRVLPPAHHKHEPVFIQENTRLGEVWKAAGLNVPVSALKTRKSWGVGDFSDLMPLIDWASAAGMNIIQLLPINDTTVTHTLSDAYPYAAISAFALHPLYLDVHKLIKSSDIILPAAMLENIHRINDAPTLEYEAALQAKLEAIKILYEKEQHNFKDDFAWFEFMEMNRNWLVPYAAFCYLRDKNKTADASQWGEYSIYNEEAIQVLANPSAEHYPEIAIHYFTQFHLHLQLKDAVDYAHKKNIVIKGDLPIGVNTCSVDTWMSPHLFHMHMQAGAPPDAFTEKGQNWSFPTYNWTTMEADGFSWWRQRMEHLSIYFDAIRIDHVLGFFRIWSIPMHATEGILGRFKPAYPIAGSIFSEAGINFNVNAYTKPVIDDEIILRLFGIDAEWIKANCLRDNKLVPECATQRAATTFFAAHPGKRHLLDGMLWLIAQVILLEDDNQPGHYHFRINMQRTEAFSRLPEHEKQILEKLYDNYFFRDQDELWRAEGVKKLELLTASSPMFICAEDLGMVPEMVPPVLNNMHMAGLVVQRMPQRLAERFANINKTSFLTVVTPSTHDMSPLRLWWKEDKEATQYFYNHVLGHYGAAPDECTPWIATEIVTFHLQAPAIWAIFLLQDILAMNEELRRENAAEERINNPANPNHYWNYRMHLCLEDLKENKKFTRQLKELIAENGR
ncbi:MAG: 4-alpha-glucanotransferase [Ferruginibacter sp.]